LRTRRSLIDLDDLTADEIVAILDRTGALERTRAHERLRGHTCVNMFFEQSTRTYTSFNLAELRMGADVVNLSPGSLSLATKGESIEDTAITLSAMGVDVLVLRHPEGGFPARVARSFDGHVINAGDGIAAHPTQALLDLYTLRREFGNVRGRRVAIVGDVAHSRVARSSISGLRTLGALVTLVGPPELLPDALAQDGVEIERDFDRAIGTVDAIILLRLQRERFGRMEISDDEYVARYRLDARRLARVRPETIVMHPGPYNRGMELDDSVLKYTGWRYAQQVMHGVPVRMAVLDFLVNGADSFAAC